MLAEAGSGWDSRGQSFVLRNDARFGNFDRFPELLAEKAVWIEVEPVTPELRVWAFVSVTNDETQQVTLITPVGR